MNIMCQRDLADRIELRILRWSDCPGLPGCPHHAITDVLTRSKWGFEKKEM